MSFAKIRPLGLRTRFMLWSSLVLAASLAAGFGWVHYGLRRVLDARDEALLNRKAVELLAGVAQYGPEGTAGLEAEIRREVLADESQGLIVVLSEPNRTLVAPDTDAARRLAAYRAPAGPPVTVSLDDTGLHHRVLVARPRHGDSTLTLGISLSETERTLAAFDRLVAGGALAFLLLSAAGGLILSRLALRPVAASIRAARRIAPEDLTERLPLTGADDELDELAMTINDLLDRLAAYHAQVIRFTADASHELRSPLAAMRAAVEVVLQSPRGPEDYRNVLATLGEQCERLTALVNGLLLLARADAGEIAIRRESVDLSALTGDVIDMFDPLAEERGLRLIGVIGPTVIVSGDPSRLRQLVTNLVDNSIRFTEPGGSVTVRVRGDADRAQVVVADTGIGIPAEHLPHIFERFYQADASRACGGGLGLSICRWIVKAHGGTIEARSGGGGAEFVVTLPQTRGTMERPPSYSVLADGIGAI